MNSITPAWLSRTDPDDGDYDWNGPPLPQSGPGAAGAADAGDLPGGTAPTDAGDEPSVDPCTQFESNHDFDACVDETIADGVLFYQQANEANAIDSRDVAQNVLGDCYVFACLAGLAQTPEGRDLLHQAIAENKNDHGDVTGWTVTLHQPDVHLFGGTTFHEVHVTVDTSFVTGHAKPRPVAPGESAQKEIWPLVLEKAIATHLGGYNALNRGGNPGDVMALLTGREANGIFLQGAESLLRGYGAQQVASDLAAGRFVVLETPPDPTDANPRTAALPHGLHAGHAYFVIGIEPHDGQPALKLGNPWGFDPPEPIPAAELARWFWRANVGSTR